MVLSSGVLVAIVVILTQYDDRPQPAWRLVSLNSVILVKYGFERMCLIYKRGNRTAEVGVVQTEEPTLG